MGSIHLRSFLWAGHSGWEAHSCHFRRKLENDKSSLKLKHGIVHIIGSTFMEYTFNRLWQTNQENTDSAICRTQLSTQKAKFYKNFISLSTLYFEFLQLVQLVQLPQLTLLLTPFSKGWQFGFMRRLVLSLLISLSPKSKNTT